MSVLFPTTPQCRKQCLACGQCSKLCAEQRTEARSVCHVALKHASCFGPTVTAVALRGLAPTPPSEIPVCTVSPRQCTFIGLLGVSSIDEPVQDVIVLSESQQDPHDLLGVGVDVQQGLHQAGLPRVRGRQLMHEEVCRQGHGMSCR